MLRGAEAAAGRPTKTRVHRVGRRTLRGAASRPSFLRESAQAVRGDARTRHLPSLAAALRRAPRRITARAPARRSSLRWARHLRTVRANSRHPPRVGGDARAAPRRAAARGVAGLPPALRPGAALRGRRHLRGTAADAGLGSPCISSAGLSRGAQPWAVVRAGFPSAEEKGRLRGVARICGLGREDNIRLLGSLSV